MIASRSCLSLGPFTNRVCAILTTPPLKLGRRVGLRMLFLGAPTITSSWRLSPGVRRAADGHATNENRLRPSSSFDPEFLRKAARLAREREILECPSEQNWRDTRNDHFRSALRTGRRSFFGWQFLASHVISFRPRLFGARPIDEGGPVGSGPRCESGGKPPFGCARLKVRTFQGQALWH
jgi:hypothetical protein